MSIGTFKQRGLGLRSIGAGGLANNERNKPKGWDIPIWKRPRWWRDFEEYTDTDDVCEQFVRVPPSGTMHRVKAWGSSGSYKVDWGDGSPVETFSSNTIAEHSYSYEDVPANIGSTVSYIAESNLVTLTEHGYQDGDYVSMFNPSGTYEVEHGRTYIVKNSSENSFQISKTSRGEVLSFSSDGSGDLAGYRLASAKVMSPDASIRLTTVDLGVINNTTKQPNAIAAHMNTPNISAFTTTTSYTSFRVPLKYLSGSNCSSLSNFRYMFSLHLLKNIEELDMSNATSISNINVVSNSTGLRGWSDNFTKAVERCTTLDKLTFKSLYIPPLNFSSSVLLNNTLVNSICMDITINYLNASTGPNLPDGLLSLYLNHVYGTSPVSTLVDSQPTMLTDSYEDIRINPVRAEKPVRVPQVQYAEEMVLPEIYDKPDLNSFGQDQPKLKTLPAGLKPGAVFADFNNLFQFCHNLDVVDATDLTAGIYHTGIVYDAYDYYWRNDGWLQLLFNDCNGLRSLAVTEEPARLGLATKDCRALVELDIIVPKNYALFSPLLPFVDCRLLSYIGNNSIRDIDGNFPSNKAYYYSTTAIVPMFAGCFNLQTIEDLDCREFRDGYNYGISIQKNYSLEKIDIKGVQNYFKATRCNLGKEAVELVFRNLYPVSGDYDVRLNSGPTGHTNSVSTMGELGTLGIINTGSKSVSLSGISLTTEIGTIKAGTAGVVSLTNVSAQGSLGQLVASGDSVQLTGVSTTGAVNDFVTLPGGTVYLKANPGLYLADWSIATAKGWTINTTTD